MAITLNSDRQWPLVATVTINYDDVTSGVAAKAVHLPGGARVTGGRVGVTTAFDSVTSDAVTIGDSTTADRFLGSTSVAATGLTALTGADEATADGVYVTWTQVGGGTSAGTMFVEVEYVIDGRGNESSPE